jgi:ankyrin repeat protein
VAAGVKLNEPANMGESPIFIAARHNNLAALRVLSALGCVDAPDPYSGLTAAGFILRRIAACQFPQIPNTVEKLSDRASEELEVELFGTLYEDLGEELHDNSSEESTEENIETLRAMLDCLAHQHDEEYLPLQSCLNLATNSSLDTMLHNVCKLLDVETLEKWIEHHQDGHIVVNFNQPNVNGTTPLMQAVIAERYTYNVPRDDDLKAKIRNFILRLVNAGANINAQDRYQRDALFLALCEGCFTSYKALLECGADPIASHTFRRAFYSKRVDYIDIISALKIFIQHKNPTPWTLGKLVHTLVSLLHDAEPINKYTDESRFLDLIIRRLTKHTHALHAFRPETKLLKPHDLIEAVDEQGETPIFTAIRLGKVDFVRYFLSKNCNLLTTNNRNETLWDLANPISNPTIINLLSIAKQKLSTPEGIKEYFDSFGCHQPAVTVLYRLKLLDENLDGNLRALFWTNGITTPDRPSNITFSFTPKEPDSECVSDDSYSEDEQADSAEALSDNEENVYRFE